MYQLLVHFLLLTTLALVMACGSGGPNTTANSSRVTPQKSPSAKQNKIEPTVDTQPQTKSFDVTPKLSLAEDTSCLLQRDGSISCWGKYGEDIQTILPPSKLPTPPAKDIALAATATNTASCLITQDDQVRCGFLRKKDIVISGIEKPHGLALSFNGGCALSADGGLYCWPGLYRIRQNVENVQAKLLPGFENVAAFRLQTDNIDLEAGTQGCARFKDGTTRCWTNSDPATQYNTTHSSVPPDGPFDAEEALCVTRKNQVLCNGVPTVLLPQDVSVASLSMAQTNSGCLLGDDHQVYCFGQEFYGVRGKGEILIQTNNTESVVHDVFDTVTRLPMKNVVAMDRSKYHGCALDDEDQVWCWGSNRWGQTGSPYTAFMPPTEMLIGPIDDIAVRHNRTCVVQQRHNVLCTQEKSYFGQQGTFKAATATSGNKDIYYSHLTNGDYGICVVESQTVTKPGKDRPQRETLVCLGSRTEKEIRIPLPPRRKLLIEKLTIGEATACVLTDTHNIECFSLPKKVPSWDTQPPVQRVKPSLLRAFQDVRDIHLSYYTLHVVTADGTILQLRTDDLFEPGEPLNEYGPVSRFSSSGGGHCTIADSSAGEVRCGEDGESPRVIDGIANAAQLVSGQQHTCVRDGAGNVHCVGGNFKGALGMGAKSGAGDYYNKFTVPLPAPAVELSSASNSTCAVLRSHGVYCWGDNDYGQLGIGMGSYNPNPQPVRFPGTAGYQSLPSFQESMAVQTAHQFWTHLANREYPSAIGISSYPFDMDAADDCITNDKEFNRFFATEPLPADKNMVVQGSYLVTSPLILELEQRWRDKLKLFTRADAQCLRTPANPNTTIHIVFVKFAVNGTPVGALTRVRCAGTICTVAGIDN